MHHKVLIFFLAVATLICNLSPATAGILVPSGDLDRPESGITLNLHKYVANSIFFRNQRRRRAIVTMVATHVKATGGEWETFSNETYNRMLSIPSTQALGSVVGSAFDILNGNFAFAEQNSKPMILSVPDGYTSAKYRVTVFGTFSNWNENPLEMTDFEQQAFVLSLAENYVCEILVPALLAKVGKELDNMSDGAAAKDALTKSQLEVVTAVAKHLMGLFSVLTDEKTLEKLKTGDHIGFLREMFNNLIKKLYNENFIDIMAKAVLASAKDMGDPDKKTVIAHAVKNILGSTSGIDAFLAFINEIKTFYDMHNARLAEIWEVQVTPRSVVVIPGEKVTTAYTGKTKITIKLKDNKKTSQNTPFRLSLSTTGKLVKLLLPGSSTWTFDTTYEQKTGIAAVRVGISPWLSTGTDTLSISAYDWNPDTGAQALIDTVEVTVQVLDTQPKRGRGGIVYRDCYDEDRNAIWRYSWIEMENEGDIACHYDLDETCEECKKAIPYGNTWFLHPTGCGVWTVPLTCDANLNNQLNYQRYWCFDSRGFDDGTEPELWSYLDTWSYMPMPDTGVTCYEYWGMTPRCRQVMHLCQ